MAVNTGEDVSCSNMTWQSKEARAKNVLFYKRGKIRFWLEAKISALI